MRLLPALVPLVLAACAASQSGGPVLPGYVSAPPPPMAAAADGLLTGTLWSWQGTQVSSDVRIAPDAPGKYTLQFDPGGRVNVRADCNRGSGSYSLDGNALVFGPIALTRAMCPPGSRDAEFLRGLQNVTGHLLTGGDLVLTLKDDGGSMRFTTPRQ